VTYTIGGEWPTGFLGNITVTNTGTRPVNGWKLAWTFPDGQQVSQMWGADAAGVGNAVTATNVSWDAQIAPRTSVSLGFIGTWTSQNREPSGFALNGASCEVL
jgi:cellulase/cellobiase CelA1